MSDHPVLIALAVLAAVVLVGVAILGLTGAWNRFAFQVQKIDDATNYRTIKQVEDSCRAMISLATSLKLPVSGS